MRPREDGLPFSVRLLNDSLRLLNLLNPPELESSLLGEPGIMLVWNIKQRSSLNFWGEVWDVICKNSENKSSWILCNIGDGWKKDTITPAARHNTTLKLISSESWKNAVLLIDLFPELHQYAVCVYACSVLYFLSQQAPRACQCCGFHGNKRRNVAANSKQLVDKAKTHCAELFPSQSEQARGCKSCFHPGSACARATMKQTASGSCTCYQQQQLPKPFLTARPVQ